MKIIKVKELAEDYPLRQNRGLIYQVLYQCDHAEFLKFDEWRESTGIRILAGPASLHFRSSEDLTVFMLKWS